MKKITVYETVKTVTEFYKKKWQGVCKTEDRDIKDASINIIFDDEDECKVVKVLLSSKGYNDFHVSVLEITDPKEYSMRINEPVKELGIILDLIKDNFKFTNI